MRELISAGERKTEAGSSSLISAQTNKMSSDKGKFSDERAFAVTSTPKPLQPADADQVTVSTEAANRQQVDRVAEPNTSVKTEPTLVRVVQEEPSVTACQAVPRGQEDKLREQAARQQEQRAVRTDVKVAESSKPEPAFGKAAPVSRTDPAQLHKLLSQRIEQTLSSKQEESITTTTHEMKSEYYKSPVSSVQSTAASTKDGVVEKEGVGTQRPRLKSEPTEGLSTEQRQAVEKTRADVRQVRD